MRLYNVYANGIIKIEEKVNTTDKRFYNSFTNLEEAKNCIKKLCGLR